jgi:signal transduction histidine kinase
MNLSPRKALYVFLAMVAFIFAQAVWWVIFMAKLVAEKVDMARELSGDPELVARIREQEIQRQIMVGFEGTFFLLVFLVGIWLIYRALVKAEELKFHQQNFLMAVTHELKTPLASMRIYLDSLLSPKIAPEKKEAIIPKIKEDVGRLEKMVENILEAGRFERSGYRLAGELFDFSALIAERARVLGDLPSKITKQVHTDIEPNLTVWGDQAALGRAVDAIMENSLKYHDGHQIWVSISLRGQDDQVLFEVTDKGVGFDRKEAKSIFERFYRAGSEMTRQAQGTGLGLYLCREIIRAHGGTVAAQSDGHGKGAKFIVTLKRGPRDENYSAR